MVLELDLTTSLNAQNYKEVQRGLTELSSHVRVLSKTELKRLR
jgi:hypothetical protein